MTNRPITTSNPCPALHPRLATNCLAAKRPALGLGIAAFAVLLPGLIWSQPADQATADLRPKYTVGQRFLHRLSTQQDQQISNPGAAEPMKQETQHTQDVALLVAKERAGGGHELDVEFVAQQLETRMGGRVAMSFDSKTNPTEDSANPLAPMLRHMTGAKIKLLTDAQGKIEHVEGLKELAQKMAADGSLISQAVVQSMVGGDSLKHLGLFPEGLPSKPVKIGDRWPVRTEFSLGPLGKVSLFMQFVLRGWETRRGHSCAILDHTGTISTPAPPTGAPAPPAKVTGDSSGRTWYCPDLGVTVESNAKQKMNLRLTMMGQQMAILVQVATTNQLVEVGKIDSAP
ncbi:MAG: hypothetical protein FJ387_08970 [Verrucomicrobia bacterium]|nr:hypothetical protein [Verrucomicrobiota bacterium]